MRLQNTDIQSTLASSLDLIEKCFAENEEKQFKIRDNLRFLEGKRLMSEKAIGEIFTRILKVEDELLRDVNEAIDSKGESLRLSLHKLEVMSGAIKEKRDHINNLMKGKINEDLDDNIENIHRSILEISFKSNESISPVDVLEFMRSDKFEKLFQKENFGYIRQLYTLPEDVYFAKQSDVLTDVDTLCCLELVCKQDCPELRDYLKCVVEDQEGKHAAHTLKHTGDGRYVAQFVPMKLGYYTVSVSLYGQPIAGSPVMVYVTPPARRSNSRYGKAMQQNNGNSYNNGSVMYVTPSYESSCASMSHTNFDTPRRYPRATNGGLSQTMSDYRMSKSYTSSDDRLTAMDLMAAREKGVPSMGGGGGGISYGSSNTSSTNSSSTQIISKFKISTVPRITYSKEFLVYCGGLPVTHDIKDDLKKHRIILRDFGKGNVPSQATMNGIHHGYKECVGSMEPHLSPSTGAKKIVERMDCGDAYGKPVRGEGSDDKVNKPRDNSKGELTNACPVTYSGGQVGTNRTTSRDQATVVADRQAKYQTKMAPTEAKSPTEDDDDNSIFGNKLKALMDEKKMDVPTVPADQTLATTKRYSDETCKRNRALETLEIGRSSSALSGISSIERSKKKVKYVDQPGATILSADPSDPCRKDRNDGGQVFPIWTPPTQDKAECKVSTDLENLDEKVRRLSLSEIFGGKAVPKRPACNVRLKSMISSNVVRGPGIDCDLVLQIGKWGKGILGTFNFPIGITVCPFSNNIIICDSGNDKIKIFDENGNQEVVIGTSTKERRFTRPSAAVVLDNGNICIKDDFRLQIYSPTGKFVQAFGDGHVNRPYGLGVTNRGWIVTCCYTFPDPTLQFYDSETGKLAQQSSLYTICGSWRQGSKCRFLAVHEDWIAITDLGKHLVYRVNFEGKPLAIFGGHNNNSHVDLIEPSGIAVDSEGTLAIADSKSDRIHIFDKDGNYICPLRTTKNGSLVSLSKPADMCFGPDGCLYIVNLLGHNTMKYKFVKD